MGDKTDFVVESETVLWTIVKLLLLLYYFRHIETHLESFQITWSHLSNEATKLAVLRSLSFFCGVSDAVRLYGTYFDKMEVNRNKNAPSETISTNFGPPFLSRRHLKINGLA